MHKVSVSKARAIVVLAEEGNADQVSFADQAKLYFAEWKLFLMA